MNNILIKNVRIVDAFTDKSGDVYIKDGLISKCNDFGNEEYITIDGNEKVLMPAFTDMHVHFRDPGFTHKEDMESGSKAAVRGGYTTVVLMANTKPVCSNMETVNYVRHRAEEIGLVDVEQVVTITDGLKGETIEHLNSIDDSVKFISDDGKGVMNSKLMEDALALSAKRSFRVISHAEDSSFSATDMRKAEDYMTNRDIYACQKVNGKLHMAHVSTKESINAVIKAKEELVDVTCEVTPHHIFATEDIKYRVNPPLRKQEDVEAILSAIRDGYVDVISTDHAPHTAEDKQNGAPGISGIESSFQICLTKLVKDDVIGLNELSELMSKNPAELIGINKGLIKPGYEGDLVLVDIDKKAKIDVSKFASKGKNSPFDGCEVYGEILKTIKHGKIVYNKADE